MITEAEECLLSWKEQRCSDLRQSLLELYTLETFLLKSFSRSCKATLHILFILLVGSLCNCILPEALKASAVSHETNIQGDSEKKRLRSAFSCLSSISMPQREVSMSSLFLHSHYKGCLPPWELKRSKSTSLKQQ